MSYRYAIGLKPEREDDYFNVVFNSPEYHALVSEFREFLKKKKIENVSLDMVHPENFLKYKKIKRPLNSYLKNPYIVEYINEEYIIKDNLKPEKND